MRQSPKLPPPVLAPSVAGLDEAPINEAPIDPRQYAEGRYERAREGADPGMLMNPVWAKYFDALNAAAPGGFGSAKGSASLSGLQSDAGMGLDTYQVGHSDGADTSVSQDAINQRAARLGLKGRV